MATAVIPVTIPSVTHAVLFPVATSLGSAGNATSVTIHVGNAPDVVDAIAKVAAYQSRLDSAATAAH